MRAINHALTGAVIGLTIKEPLVAMPLAFASHLVLDIIPHWDLDWKGYKGSFNYFLLADVLLCLFLAIWLFVALPSHWLLPVSCAFLGTSLDFLHLREWLTKMAGKTYVQGKLGRFLSDIQWATGPWGALIEIPWFITGVWCLNLLK